MPKGARWADGESGTLHHVSREGNEVGGFDTAWNARGGGGWQELEAGDSWSSTMPRISSNVCLSKDTLRV